MTRRDRLETARLRLRPLTGADEAALVDALADHELVKWLAAVPWPFTAADFHVFLDHARGGHHWVIDDDQGLAGIISLAPHLGYWVARRAQGQGYATEAARAVLAAHFADPDAGDVGSGYFEGNAASARVLTRLGFQPAGQHLVPARAQGRTLPHIDMTLTRASYAQANPLRVRTARLTLDPLCPEDAAPFRRIVTTPSVGRMLFIFPPDWPLSEAEAFVHKWRWTGTPPFRLALRLNGQFIGAIGLRSLADPEVFYFLDPAHAGQGYLSEALPAFIACITRHFGMTRLTAEVFTDNPASARLLQKAGFQAGDLGTKTSPARGLPAPVRHYHFP